VGRERQTAGGQILSRASACRLLVHLPQDLHVCGRMLEDRKLWLQKRRRPQILRCPQKCWPRPCVRLPPFCAYFPAIFSCLLVMVVMLVPKLSSLMLKLCDVERCNRYSQRCRVGGCGLRAIFGHASARTHCVKHRLPLQVPSLLNPKPSPSTVS